ncbi:MAG: CapA family protein, partial [Bacteroidales bacterium]|nr:CapA family protein [Bacteroidales bacterium]
PPGRDTSVLTLLFAGDIMGHDGQIEAAWNDSLKNYDYNDVFRYISEDLTRADFAVANLEVTLAGPPFKGYPQFSSPDALAVAAKNAGIDAFVTANNHSCDRGKKGIIRTINVLDSLQIKHTGTFRNPQEKIQNNLLILEKNGISAGILNYTYGTNGIPVPEPTIVNLLNKDLIREDAEAAKAKGIDILIAFVHWGAEYMQQPDGYQEDMAAHLFSCGVDVIIGSHPHVIQKMMWTKHPEKDSLIVFSLGNFVSNQRKRYCDGGVLFEMKMTISGNDVIINEAGYYLTWVYRKTENGKTGFHILPCSRFEDNPEFFSNRADFDKMKLFIDDSRNLLRENNINIGELPFRVD